MFTLYIIIHMWIFWRCYVIDYLVYWFYRLSDPPFKVTHSLFTFLYCNNNISCMSFPNHTKRCFLPKIYFISITILICVPFVKIVGFLKTMYKPFFSILNPKTCDFYLHRRYTIYPKIFKSTLTSPLIFLNNFYIIAFILHADKYEYKNRLKFITFFFI